jgi:hypothetical protein
MTTSLKQLCAVAVIVVVCFATWIVVDSLHSIKNGSQIFSKVVAIRNAVPSNASDLRMQSSSASWISGCSEIPGSRSGWTTDQASVMFIDTSSRATVTREIDDALKRQGWQRHDSKPNPSAGRLPHWTLDVKSAHVVQAWAFPVGPGTHHWYFSARWNPPGPRGQGCP